VTCGPLEGVLSFICRSLIGESLNMEVEGSLDLHLGHEANMLDDATPSPWDNLDERCFLWRHLIIHWR